MIMHPSPRHRASLIGPLSALLTLALVTAALAARAPKADPAAAREQELTALKAQAALLRDSLQVEVAERYRAKQRAVEQRETDKDELEQLTARVEQAYGELSRIKEERLVAERTLSDARDNLATKQDEWQYVPSALNDILSKEADNILNAFPLDQEQRRQDLETVRSALTRKGDAAAALAAYLRYRLTYVGIAESLSLVKRSVFPQEGGPQLLTIARLGSVLAYGLNDKGETFIIRQSGRLGRERFIVEKVGAEALSASLSRLFPGWVASGKLSGAVPIDVLQNEQSGQLVAGKKVSFSQSFMHSIKSGGAIMLPLLLLGLWALSLLLLKFAQLTVKRLRYARHFRTISAGLKSRSPQDVLSGLGASGSAVSRIFAACVGRSSSGKASAEKAAREAFAEELPSLNSYLNTLAVIAGAAPLLGLLGTISGMINLFGAVTHYGTGDPKFLAGGISEALVTAKTGLAIAIPALFAHNYLRNLRDRMAADLEKYAIRMLNALFPE